MCKKRQSETEERTNQKSTLMKANKKGSVRVGGKE